ncbi:Quinoprotein amine dehydrogenase [Cordyceps fumosorosea ARSEF 2679]|uniref:Quinoprotein amine dehydrogenase n=1 Tax=Cordyceps fumosorosea (strain ARSEF 2679) TaxID=1081104 RepID=A0A162JE69_CORFA|nr:Quinoprotein amine dehydrogenase [Cordyceps fumosorosea ARSEF 2679]OAA43058.1 Quinoprotein amine dehydrogenase [Cordyceps fumosorosea ARSEF 2679]
MKIPYNCLHTHRNVLFAARGGKIHTFNLLDGAHIARWQHPELQTCIVADVEASSAVEPGQQDADDAVVADEEAQQPPSKRQKVTTGDGGHQSNDAEEKAGGKKARAKEQRKPKPIPVPDRPTIIQLATTSDGSHLVAVSSHDKAVWVFKHDGAGQLTQLSKRIMPKRPSAITVSPDSQILVADKFGDVYAIPLIKSSEPYVPPPNASSSTGPQNPAATAQPAATVLTVHSKGNRAALAAQQRQLEKPTEAVRAEGPDFAHTLLLGHVSMLTALVLGEDAQRRRYILTGDRDEHIRVSRYVPQAHVIHGYCLGHREFVGAMTIPPRRKELLVSGGGDEDLLVWDWVNGKLLSRTSIVTPAKEVIPQASAVAVSRLLALEYPGEQGPQTHIVAICEGIPAVFTWQLLEDNTLTRPGVIQLPGKPLDIAESPASDDTVSLSVALHVPEGSSAEAARSLHIIRLMVDDGRLAVNTIAPVGDESLESSEQDVVEEDVRTLFYTVEHLRKQQASGQEEGETEQQGDSVAEE